MSGPAGDPAPKLARMAGEIAAFFEAYPREQGVAAVADHINQYWSRHMREEFLAAYGDGDASLHPLVSGALPRIRRTRSGDPGPLPSLGSQSWMRTSPADPMKNESHEIRANDSNLTENNRN